MKRARFAVLFAALFAFLPLTSLAQVQTGTPAFGTYSSGPDVINLANLNSEITVPLLNKAGRGIPFTFNLTQDSSVWYPVKSGSTTSWVPVNHWGWNQSIATIGSLIFNIGQSGFLERCDGGEYEGTRITYSGWTYADGFHGRHPFSIVTTATLDACTNQWTYTSGQGYATDNSNYYLSIVNASQLSELLGPDGSNINPGTGAGSLEDRNGNLISISNSGVVTDTLDQTALTMAGSGTPSSPVTFTYTPPAGGTAQYKEIFSSETVQTKFACSGVVEFGPTTENLVTEIDLPDQGTIQSDRYLITYETTPGDNHSPHYVTGRIASIQFPTGGTITYTYSGGSNGITCADGSAATLTRTTPDGTWSYAHTENGNVWSTAVTDPQGNVTDYDFNGIYQTEQQVYQGSSNLLKTVLSSYNYGSGGNVTQKTVYTKWPSGLESETVTKYTGYALPTEEDDYDYGSGSPGNLLRTELINYAPLGNNIVDAPSQMTIENGSGGVVAQTNITYDQGTPATTGAPQHVSITGSRGNPTTVSYTVAGSTQLSKSFTYFDTGNVQAATDVNGATTTYKYSDATSTCGYAFPSSVSEPLSLSKSMTWNCTGGVETSATDENGQIVSTAYSDAYYWRPASSTDQESNQTTFYYQPNAQNGLPYTVASFLKFNGGNSIASDIQYKDGLGRTFDDQKYQSGSETPPLDTVSYTFDANGRLASTSGPCAASGWTQMCTGPTTTQTYDALNRPYQTTDGGGGTVTLTYSANDVLQVIGPKAGSENLKERQMEYNSLGELTSVCEITNVSGSGSCGQNTAATGFLTKYTYDAIGDLLTVTQNAQSGSPQSRTYTYDGLGRMLSETNPESGTETYAYDAPTSDCSNSAWNGDMPGTLVQTRDANGNVTCYFRDALKRPVTIYVAAGPGQYGCRIFEYDNSMGFLGSRPNGVVSNNSMGRLTEALTTNCGWPPPQAQIITDEWFSYTPRGELATEYQATPQYGGYSNSASYWANGAVNKVTGFGSPFTYGVDGEGRINTVSAGGGQNPVTGTIYNPASEATAVTLGSGDNDAFTFDPNTFRMTQYQYNVNGQSVTGALTWNANGSLGKLAITDAFNAANTQTCNYTHDDLARIASANCGSGFSDTYTYDAFGNLTKNGTFQFQPGYNSNNQMSNATYDANGDVLNDGLHSYQWNAETRPTTIDSVTVTYDALGRMVEQDNNGTYTDIIYVPGGAKLLYNAGSGNTTLVKALVPLPGGGTAVYNASGLQYYRHPDWLGSARFASTPSRTMYSDLAYTPFGVPYAQAGSTGVTDISFGGNNEDTTTSLYDAQFREYGIQGRWPSPDPAGIAAANPANPQSWNRYAYVMNNPLKAIDPTGLFCMWDDGSYDADDDPGEDPNWTYNPDSCSDAGGTWFDGSPSDYGLTADWSNQPNSNLAGFINDFTNGQGGGSGGLVNPSDYKNFVQNGPSSGLSALQQAGNLASPQNIFTIWGASVTAGASPFLTGGFLYLADVGYGWVLENPEAVALITDYVGGMLSPTPGPFTPAGVTGNLAGCSAYGPPAPYCPGAQH